MILRLKVKHFPAGAASPLKIARGTRPIGRVGLRTRNVLTFFAPCLLPRLIDSARLFNAPLRAPRRYTPWPESRISGPVSPPRGFRGPSRTQAKETRRA